MRNLFLTLFFAALCAATSYGQTMKALSYNASNGVVAYSNTNTLQLPSAVKFGGDTRIISSIFQFGGVDRISLEETRFVGDWTFADSITFEAAASVRTNLDLGATWLTNTNVTNFRTAIGLPLPALTNTSNVTTMRALSGSTNTNQPFSGTVEYHNHNADPFFMEISNGIILRIYE